ncbi:MAG: hypothetical protein ABI167_05480 [Nitrosospira sp.]
MKDTFLREQIEYVEYLVRRKYPNASRVSPYISLSQISSGYGSNKDLFDEINAYRKLLTEMSFDELKNLHDTEKTKELELIKRKSELEESKKFYNLLSANADFVYWGKIEHWTLDEAIALSFGKTPEIVSWKTIEPLTNSSTFAKEYAKRRELAIRAHYWKKLYDPILPSIFLAWAKEAEIAVPSDLITEVQKKRGGTGLNWFDEYCKVKTELERYTAIEKNGKEQPFSAEELESLFDKNHPHHPSELYFAIKAWQAVNASSGKGQPKARIKAWLDENAKDLSNEAKERIATSANWHKVGGATKTK